MQAAFIWRTKGTRRVARRHAPFRNLAPLSYDLMVSFHGILRGSPALSNAQTWGGGKKPEHSGRDDSHHASKHMLESINIKPRVLTRERFAKTDAPASVGSQGMSQQSPHAGSANEAH